MYSPELFTCSQKANINRDDNKNSHFKWEQIERHMIYALVNGSACTSWCRISIFVGSRKTQLQNIEEIEHGNMTPSHSGGMQRYYDFCISDENQLKDVQFELKLLSFTYRRNWILHELKGCWSETLTNHDFRCPQLRIRHSRTQCAYTNISNNKFGNIPEVHHTGRRLIRN